MKPAALTCVSMRLASPELIQNTPANQQCWQRRCESQSSARSLNGAKPMRPASKNTLMSHGAVMESEPGVQAAHFGTGSLQDRYYRSIGLQGAIMKPSQKIAMSAFLLAVVGVLYWLLPQFLLVGSLMAFD